MLSSRSGAAFFFGSRELHFASFRIRKHGLLCFSCLHVSDAILHYDQEKVAAVQSEIGRQKMP
jgi:hypothetical protein